MTGLRGRSPCRRSSSLTRGDLLCRLGQAVLWLLVLVLLVRGVSQLLTVRGPAAVAPVKRAALAAWPDDEARAFGAAFARAYLARAGSADARACRVCLSGASRFNRARSWRAVSRRFS